MIRYLNNGKASSVTNRRIESSTSAGVTVPNKFDPRRYNGIDDKVVIHPVQFERSHITSDRANSKRMPWIMF